MSQELVQELNEVPSSSFTSPTIIQRTKQSIPSYNTGASLNYRTQDNKIYSPKSTRYCESHSKQKIIPY